MEESPKPDQDRSDGTPANEHESQDSHGSYGKGLAAGYTLADGLVVLTLGAECLVRGTSALTAPARST